MLKIAIWAATVSASSSAVSRVRPQNISVQIPPPTSDIADTRSSPLTASIGQRLCAGPCCDSLRNRPAANTATRIAVADRDHLIRPHPRGRVGDGFGDELVVGEGVGVDGDAAGEEEAGQAEQAGTDAAEGPDRGSGAR